MLCAPQVIDLGGGGGGVGEAVPPPPHFHLKIGGDSPSLHYHLPFIPQPPPPPSPFTSIQTYKHSFSPPCFNCAGRTNMHAYNDSTIGIWNEEMSSQVHETNSRRHFEGF